MKKKSKTKLTTRTNFKRDVKHYLMRSSANAKRLADAVNEIEKIIQKNK